MSLQSKTQLSMSIAVNLYLSLLGKIPVLGLIILASIFIIFGDYSAKSWSINHREMWLFFAFVGYFFSAFFYIPTLLREGLIISSITWALVSTIGFLLIGFIIFKETLSVSQTIAVICGTISRFILTLFD